MCEAHVYLWEDGREELVLESVDKVIPSAEGVYLENIFGQRKTVQARIKELQLVDHRILLERVRETKI